MFGGSPASPDEPWRVEADLMVGTLGVRLMVGHCPLEAGIGVRVPDPQHYKFLGKERA